jgi:hypothetical protein
VARVTNQNATVAQPEHQDIDALNNVQRHLIPEPRQPNGTPQKDLSDRSSDTQHGILNAIEFDFHSAAKKRRIDLEFRLKQAKIKQDRELKDLKLKNAREREDLELEI